MATGGKRKVIQHPQAKRRKEQQYATFGWIVVLSVVGFLVFASALWWGFNIIKTSLVSKFVAWEPAKQGVLEVVTPMDFLLIREERVVNTLQGGKLKPVAAEGERVRKGALVAYVTTPTTETGTGLKDIPLYAPATGIICYHVDGLENIDTAENLEKLGAAKLLASAKSIPAPTKENTAGFSFTEEQQSVDQLQAGQPVFKVFNNLKPTMFLSDLSKTEVDPGFIKEGKNAYGRLGSVNDEPISFRVQPGTKSRSIQQYLLMTSSSNRTEFMHNRTAKIDLISSRFQGYIIPKSALVKKNGQSGIYIVYKETTSWEPVQIKGEVKEHVAVVSVEKPGVTHLVPNSLVVTNPSFVQEGQQVYVR